MRLWFILLRDLAGIGSAPPVERFAAMLGLLHHDKAWLQEYDTFVLQVSFAGSGDRISFAEALAATQRLVASVS